MAGMSSTTSVAPPLPNCACSSSAADAASSQHTMDSTFACSAALQLSHCAARSRRSITAICLHAYRSTTPFSSAGSGWHAQVAPAVVQLMIMQRSTHPATFFFSNWDGSSIPQDKATQQSMLQVPISLRTPQERAKRVWSAETKQQSNSSQTKR